MKGDFMADFSKNTPTWQWTGEAFGFAFNFRPARAMGIVGARETHPLSRSSGRAGRPLTDGISIET